MKRSDFIKAVLEKVGGVVNGPRIQFGVAWATFEDTQATNNPFATTEPGFNSTEFNSVGVKNYPTWEDGVDATVATLNNGYYDHLLQTLRTPECTIREVINSLNSSPWGSHPTEELYVEVGDNYPHYDVEIPGSPAEPKPVEPTPTETPEQKEHAEIESHVVIAKSLPIVKVGDSNKACWAVNKILNGPIGMVFTAETEQAVKSWQESLGLKVDGIVGPETWTSFFI